MIHFLSFNFIYNIEKTRNFKIACLEEIAFNKGYISKKELLSIAKSIGDNNYGKYLMNKVNN